MPQLLPFYFVNMLSYSFLLFIVILYVLSTYILPKYPLLYTIRMTLVNNTPGGAYCLELFLIILFGIYLFVCMEESEELLSILAPFIVFLMLR